MFPPNFLLIGGSKIGIFQCYEAILDLLWRENNYRKIPPSSHFIYFILSFLYIKQFPGSKKKRRFATSKWPKNSAVIGFQSTMGSPKKADKPTTKKPKETSTARNEATWRKEGMHPKYFLFVWGGGGWKTLNMLHEESVFFQCREGKQKQGALCWFTLESSDENAQLSLTMHSVRACKEKNIRLLGATMHS